MFLTPAMLGFGSGHQVIATVSRYPFSRDQNCTTTTERAAVIGPGGRAVLLRNVDLGRTDVGMNAPFAREAVPGLFPDALVADWIVGRDEPSMVAEIVELRHKSTHPDLER